MAAGKPNIDLYTGQTPNGVKVSITLDELGLPYNVHKIDMAKNVQKEPWFLEINPNGRIPAMTDTFEDGKSIRLFESGSIMQYLIAAYDKDFKISFPSGTREYYEMNNWLFFMNAGVGPMQGQATHFARYAPERIEYGIKRYSNEIRRLYGVLEKHLKDTKQDYLVGNKCTIADIAHFGWVYMAGYGNIDIGEFPTLKAWEDRMAARPGVDRGNNVPEPSKWKEMINDKEKMNRFAAHGAAWIQEGMKKDAEKHN